MKLILSLFATAALAAIAVAEENAAAPTPPVLNSPAPDFSLTSGEGTPVSLKDYQGKWIVLYFYPKDFTSGCTLEAQNFQRDLAKYQAMNAVILGG